MARWQGRSRKKPTGGRIRLYRKKRKFELGREPVRTNIGPKKLVKVRGYGGNDKVKLLVAESVNLTDPESGKSIKTEINSVLENPADPNLARRGILTKGALVETPEGKARITSRPGQEGSINAVLVERSKKPNIGEEENKKNEAKISGSGDLR